MVKRHQAVRSSNGTMARKTKQTILSPSLRSHPRQLAMNPFLPPDKLILPFYPSFLFSSLGFYMLTKSIGMGGSQGLIHDSDERDVVVYSRQRRSFTTPFIASPRSNGFVGRLFHIPSGGRRQDQVQGPCGRRGMHRSSQAVVVRAGRPDFAFSTSSGQPARLLAGRGAESETRTT
jgi:hypothetical protein